MSLNKVKAAADTQNYGSYLKLYIKIDNGARLKI